MSTFNPDLTEIIEERKRRIDLPAPKKNTTTNQSATRIAIERIRDNQELAKLLSNEIQIG